MTTMQNKAGCWESIKISKWMGLYKCVLYRFNMLGTNLLQRLVGVNGLAVTLFFYLKIIQR